MPRTPRGPLVAPHGLGLSREEKVLSVSSNGKAVFAKFGADPWRTRPDAPLHPENMDATCSDVRALAPTSFFIWSITLSIMTAEACAAPSFLHPWLGWSFEIEVPFVRTHDNLADFFTKPCKSASHPRWCMIMNEP